MLENNFFIISYFNPIKMYEKKKKKMEQEISAARRGFIIIYMPMRMMMRFIAFSYKTKAETTAGGVIINDFRIKK